MIPRLGVRTVLRETVVRFFRSLSQRAIDHPRRMLVTVALVTLAIAPGILRLKLRTDGQALVSRNAPEVVYDRSIRQQFGIQDNLVVLVHSAHPDGIFNPGTLRLIRELTSEIAQLPGIDPLNVMSLATEPGMRFRKGTYEIQRLLEPAFTNQAELDQLREDVRKIQLYTGTLVSADEKSAVILVGVPAGGDRAQIYREMAALLAAKRPEPDHLALTGAPVAESLLGSHILEDLGVPDSLLGVGAQLGAERPPWKKPSNFHELRLLIARRFGLVPLAVVVMLLVLWASFRNVPAVLTPLPGVIATMLLIFGLMGWLGVPVYLTTAVMPVLLTATGVTNDIYLFNRYFTLLADRPGVSHIDLVRETFNKMTSAVTGTSLTTGIGFLSFSFSPLGPVRAFGLCTGMGVLVGLLCSFTVVPALLTLMNPVWLRSRRRAGPSALGAWFGRIGLAMARHRRWVAGLAVLVTALTPFGIHRLIVQDSWIDGFDPDSEFRRTAAAVNRQFYGMHLLLVTFDAPMVLRGEVSAVALRPANIILPGNLVEDPALIAESAITFSIPITPTQSRDNAATTAVWRSKMELGTRRGEKIFSRIAPTIAPTNFWPELARAGHADFEVVVHSHFRPEVIRSIGNLAAFIRQRSRFAVGGVLSPWDYLTTTRFMVRTGDPESRRLTDDPAEIKLLWDYYGFARTPHRLREVVDTNYWRSVTTVFLKDANFADTAKLMADIRAYEQEHLTPKGIRLGFAGDVALSQSLIQGIVTTQLQSLFWSVVGIFLVTAVLGGSSRWGVYCVLPSALAVVIKFAVMGWAGVPLGVATSMFAAMTLGIGVNCAIQLLESYRQAREAGAPSLEASRRAMALTGPPALVNTLAVSLGFGVLMLSQVPANARLGLLVVLGLVECFIISLALLPVLLYWWPVPIKTASESNSR
jgi:predicted RND superfamily exporter protein